MLAGHFWSRPDEADRGAINIVRDCCAIRIAALRVSATYGANSAQLSCTQPPKAAYAAQTMLLARTGRALARRVVQRQALRVAPTTALRSVGSYAYPAGGHPPQSDLIQDASGDCADSWVLQEDDARPTPQK